MSVAPEKLQRGDGVGEVSSGERQRDQAQAPSAQVRRPRLARVLAATHVAAAVDDVALPFEQCLQHRHVVVRVVFEVGILDDQVVAGRRRNARRTALPFPPFRSIRSRVTPACARDDLGRPIARAVVDDDDFLVEAERRQVDGLDLLEQRADEALFVVGRNDDRQDLAGAFRQMRLHRLEFLRRVDADRLDFFETRERRRCRPTRRSTE